jgi:hypothetical protein
MERVHIGGLMEENGVDIGKKVNNMEKVFMCLRIK